MSTAPTAIEIEYPESDGQPVGETDLHIDWLFRLRDMLKYRYRDQRVYVGADLLVYFEEGNPRKFVVPDLFLTKDCDPGMRRVYKVWDEPAPPHVVIEITSASSKREDSVFKPKTYAAIGVREYFVYDPTQDYLNPPLRGFRLEDDEHVPIEPDADGWLHSRELGLKCTLDDDGALVLADSRTDEPLVERWVAEQLAREAEEEARRTQQAEVEKLREELRRLKQGD